MASTETLILASDNTIELCNLRDSATGDLATGATVSARVLDSAGDPVVGVLDPIVLTEVVGRSGLYRGSIPDGAVYAAGDIVTVVVTAVSATSQTRVFTVPSTVVAVL